MKNREYWVEKKNIKRYIFYTSMTSTQMVKMESRLKFIEINDLGVYIVFGLLERLITVLNTLNNLKILFRPTFCFIQ